MLQVNDVDDDKRLVTLTSGGTLVLHVEGHDVHIYASDKEVGRLSFREITEPGVHREEVFFLMTHAFIDGDGGIYQRQGVGTEAVRLFKEYVGEEIIFSENDGRVRSDGSHYVDGGYGFVVHLKKLIQKGEL